MHSVKEGNATKMFCLLKQASKGQGMKLNCTFVEHHPEYTIKTHKPGCESNSLRFQLQQKYPLYKSSRALIMSKTI